MQLKNIHKAILILCGITLFTVHGFAQNNDENSIRNTARKNRTAVAARPPRKAPRDSSKMDEAKKYNEELTNLENEIREGRLSQEEAAQRRLEITKKLLKQQMKNKPMPEDIPPETRRIMEAFVQTDETEQ